MGYTGGDDTLAQIELTFPTLESAVRYAERQGLTYCLRMPTCQVGDEWWRPADERSAPPLRSTHVFATLDQPGKHKAANVLSGDPIVSAGQNPSTHRLNDG
ncbi:hypothetical protein MPLB_230017 [Mesorhizobium sp. ORS 3324]|nr:hypothetical protein MPLB_230017 [Mesorhizobium sp. ORS 3324]